MKSQKTCREFKYSSEDWYPSFPDSQVEVSMSLYVLDQKQHRVSVWGDDDCGMEFWSSDLGEVKEKYKKILKMKDVTRAALRELGLYPA